MALRVAPDQRAMPRAPAPGKPHALRRGSRLRSRILLFALIAVPLILYGWFHAADAQHRARVLGTARDQAALIATSLTPLLGRDDPAAVERIDAAVRALAVEGRSLRVIRARPSGGNDADFLVASTPVATAAEFAALRGKLRDAERAGLDRATCNGSMAFEARVGGISGDAEILTAAALVATPGSCWTILIGWSSAPFLAGSHGRPFWQTREVGIAAALYLAFLAIVLARLRGMGRKPPVDAPTIDAEPVVAPTREILEPPPAHARQYLLPLLEQDLAAPRAETLDLRKHVADLVFQYHEDVTARGLSFSYEAIQPAAIRGTRSLVDGAVINLLDTALAASRPGDVVRVVVRTENGMPRLIVENGSHAEIIATDAATNRGDLRHATWVAHRNVEAMGGRLNVEKQANGMSRFIASFPAPG